MKEGIPFLITALASSSLIASHAHAQICVPAAISTNGCSVPLYAQLVDPVLVNAFSALFASACNRHDVCYQTLGESRTGCDDQFRGDMRSKCDSAFNRWLDPAGWQFCRQIGAEGYTAAVRNYGEPYWVQGQSATLVKAQSIRNQVDSEQCGMTADRTKYYSSSLMSYVTGAFATQANRAPTVYEMFDGLHSADPSGNKNTWQVAVNGYASSRASVSVPYINVGQIYGDYYFTLTSNVTPVGSPVVMKINGQTYSPPVALDAYADYYQAVNYEYKGFALARSAAGGARNLSLIDVSISRPPVCDPICP